MGHFTKIFRQEASLDLLRHSHGYHQFVHASAWLVRGFRRADRARVTAKPEATFLKLALKGFSPEGPRALPWKDLRGAGTPAQP